MGIFCKQECDSSDQADLQKKCQYCATWTYYGFVGNVKCGEIKSYEERYPCKECKKGIITNKEKPCFRCTPPQVQMVPQRVGWGVDIVTHPKKIWNKITDSGEKGADGKPINNSNCYECKEEEGKEVWKKKDCGENLTCVNGNCVPGCSEECNNCQECKAITEKPSTWRCVDKPECNLPNYGCIGYEEEPGEPSQWPNNACCCECKLFDFGTTPKPGQTGECPKDQPLVVKVHKFAHGPAGCECRCLVKPDDCEDNEKFNPGSCRCESRCDPECDTLNCMDCFPIDGQFECKNKCVAPQICDGGGNCYNPPAALSLDLTP